LVVMAIVLGQMAPLPAALDLLRYAVPLLLMIVFVLLSTNVPLVYNVQHVRNRPVSTLATALGIALVVAIFIGGLALANGFRAALVATGSPDDIIVLRKGADSELSSGIGRDVANVIRALPDVAPGPDGRPLASAEVYVNTNLPRIGPAGSPHAS